ncbi:MAG: trypsin-like peptidase domain-containing protein [Fibrobacter sp.]|nr:trypsin-like peptidase domain-containing protein [Fibrobacter sp.]
MKMHRSVVYFFIPLLLGVSFSFAQKNYDLAYTQYTSCKYNPYTEKYCTDEDDAIWKNGVVKITITQDSVLYVNLNKDKIYRIKLNFIKSDYNSDNEEIVVLTGRSETNNYMLVIGPRYFNFLKVKKWGIYFEDKSTPQKQNYTFRDFGKITYSIKGFGICLYNEETEAYDDSCSYYNYDNVREISVSSYVKKNRLFVQVDTLGQFEVSYVEDLKNNAGEMVVMYYGKDQEDNKMSVFIGKDYFNVIFRTIKMSFSEKEYAKELVEKSSGAVFGSSVAIAPNIIITNAHVIKNVSKMSLYSNGKIVENDGYEVIGELYDVLDLAIIRVNGVKLNSCPLSIKEPLLGEDILVYGYPQIQYQGADLKVTKGIVSGKNGFQGDEATFQIDAAVQHGNSGGPIVAKGKVIGLVTSILKNSQNVNFGIKSSKIYHLLQFYNVKPKSNTTDYEKCTYLIVGE